MQHTVQIVVAVLAVAAFAWLLIGRGKAADQDIEIDANDPRQIGLLIGMTGGSITDAAVARYALEKFQQDHGRKATVREMGVVAGLMRAPN